MPKKINNETRSTSLKKFRPKVDVNNGLCVGALTDVNVSDVEIQTDSKFEYFRGHTVPRLNFVFESREDPKGVKPATYIQSFLPIEHSPETVDGGDKEWKWDQLASMVKHIYLVFADRESLTKEEIDKLSVEFEDVDENGNFLEVEPDVVIDAYRKFFHNIESLFKNGDKPIYKDASGKDVILWMKLIISFKGRNVNNGDPGFPNFPGEGVIEKKIKGVNPDLQINIAKGESITPKEPVAAVPPQAPTGGVATDSKDVPSFMRD